MDLHIIWLKNKVDAQGHGDVSRFFCEQVHVKMDSNAVFSRFQVITSWLSKWDPAQAIGGKILNKNKFDMSSLIKPTLCSFF